MMKSVYKKAAHGTLFECRPPGAKAVFLAGTFNNWDESATPMERARDGTWRITLNLPPGRYEFKFVVDGHWCCEPNSEDEMDPNCVPNLFGTMNHMIDIPSRDERESETDRAALMVSQVGGLERGIL
ncbi:MAG TPA: glycogen-binding domain-containing protein [Phycisphaerae bacterium]|nr:glycogen-binding domain-containing protein [Phycisphaerae bacterium]